MGNKASLRYFDCFCCEWCDCETKPNDVFVSEIKINNNNILNYVSTICVVVFLKVCWAVAFEENFYRNKGHVEYVGKQDT